MRFRKTLQEGHEKACREAIQQASEEAVPAGALGTSRLAKFLILANMDRLPRKRCYRPL